MAADDDGSSSVPKELPPEGAVIVAPRRGGFLARPRSRDATDLEAFNTAITAFAESTGRYRLFAAETDPATGLWAWATFLRKDYAAETPTSEGKPDR